MRNLIPWLIFGILAVLLAPRMWDEFQDRSHSSTWPMVEGTLVDGYIKEVVQNATSQQGYRPGHHYFVLVVEYAYRVDGREYSGHRVRAAGISYGTEKSAKQALDALENQKPLNVYYDPNDPASSVLIPG